MNNLLQLAHDLIAVVKAAGVIEMKYYQNGVDVIDKSDGSPVTLADQEAEKLIVQKLAELAPGIPVVGEEATSAGNVPDIASGTFFLVDPLDGTREFIGHNGEFTVNIALMVDFQPVMGIVYSPVSGTLYFGAEGQAFEMTRDGAIKPIHARTMPDEGATVLISNRPGDQEKVSAYLKDEKIKGFKSISSSFKFCAIAAGRADIHARIGGTSEWDTAAGDAIVRAAGGTVKTLDGRDMVYGKKDRKFANYDFVVRGK